MEKKNHFRPHDYRTVTRHRIAGNMLVEKNSVLEESNYCGTPIRVQKYWHVNFKNTM